MDFFVAHQGGWDELAWFTIPVLLMLTWVRWAEKRARIRQAAAKEASTNMPDDTDT